MDGPGTESAATTYTIDDLLETMVALGASDLHVTVGSHPVIRLNGSLERLDQFPRLSADDSQRLLYRILSTEQQKHLEINRQIDVSYSISACRRSCTSFRKSRVASSSSRARRAPVSRPRWPLSSTRSTAPATTTS